MPTPAQVEAALAQVRDQQSFIDCLLRDTLDWPVRDDAKTVEDISYQWSADDLRADGIEKKIIDGRVWQIQPFRTNQPWGIFLLEFKHPEVFRTDRGMAGTLRKVLRGLVSSRRRRSDLPFWKGENLLFICNHNYQDFRFASFRTDPNNPGASRIAAFGWGPDIPRRTACEFNLPPLAYDPGATPEQWVANWTDAFDVERVTKRFYADYAKVFAELEASLKGPKGDEDRRLTAQTLMNRLMFLRFVERKGWLRFGKDSAYLRNLADAGGMGKKSIFRSRLDPLFFDALGSPMGDSTHRDVDAVGDVPFLGGGLFEQSEQDKKLQDVPDAALLKVIGPDGLFYRYNFTVEESTPLDIEVAVDPEMLGKVFEELVTGRHESGSYYTPRPVVAFMCREALKGYLSNKAKLTPDAAAKFVDEGEVSGLKESQARDIIGALDGLKAVDPACGSGAYLLGLLHELIRLYRLLYSDKLKRDARSLYDLKLRIISHSLYGVDIDPFATNIAMLRLWLSLVVEADDPVPLPNLDFKVETGDSLLGPDPHTSTELFGDALAARADLLIALKDKFLSAQSEQKANYRASIDKEIKEIAFKLRGLRGEGVIDWRIQFAEVFVRCGGFHVVLANPPYVRQELITDIKPALRQVYGDQYSGTADLYVFFYLRALQLLAPGGMLVFISSNKWFRAGYGLKLRSLMARESSVRTILDFHDLPVFESAIAYPMIFIAAKSPPAAGESPMLVEPPTLDPPYPDVTAVVAKFGHRLPAAAIGMNGTWHLASSTAADLLRKMRAAGPTLSEFTRSRVFRGLTTGLNEAFVLDSETRRALLSANPECAEIVKPFAGGRDVSRWRLNPADRWIIVTQIGVNMRRYPAVMKHLRRFESALVARDDQGDEWWELRPCTYYDEFPRPKLVSTKVSIEPTFALDGEGHYLGNTSYFVPVSDDALFLVGVLNSAPSKFYAQSVFVGKQNGWYEVQPAGLEGMPIPNASASDRAAIAALAQKCLDAKGEGCEAWEKEIDERVATLYGLDPADFVRSAVPAK